MKTNSTFRGSILFIIFLLTLISSVNLFAAHDLEITGSISELGSDYMVVQNYKIYVDYNSDLRGSSGSKIEFAVLKLNDLVQVQADNYGNGTFLASKIKLEDGTGGENEGENELTGYVSSVGNNSFIINGVAFVVDSLTEFRGRHGSSFSFDQITVGMLLEVKAKKQTNGDLLAIRIRTEDDEHHGEDFEISGYIDSLTSNSVIIGEKEFFVDNQTVIVDHHNMPAVFSDLTKGEKVEVRAVKQVDDTYLALNIKIEDEKENESEVELTAQIENINGSDITIGGLTFTTDANTVVLNNNRMAVALTDLAVGMWVEVKGFKNSDGSYYAATIKIEDFVRTEIEIKGNISYIENVSFIVNDITFSVDSATKVIDHLNNPAMYSDLKTGQLVEVKGNKTGDTTAMALVIKMEDSADVEISGKISAVNSDNIILNGLTIYVNDNTLYLNQANQPAMFSDLSVDLFVEVKAIKNPDSSLTAARIKIEDGMNFSKESGIAGTVNGNSIILPSGSYNISASTLIIDNNYNQINVNQLSAGQQVIVWAVMNSVSNKTALQIQSKSVNTTAVNETKNVIRNFVLEQNYPNPFNPSTTITFSISSDQFVTLKVFNAIGEEVTTLVNGNLTVGVHKVNFDAQGLSSGFYIYRLESGNSVQAKKMIMLK